MKARELRDRDIKIRREIEELFFKPTNVSVYNIEIYEEKEISNKRKIFKKTYGTIGSVC